MLGDERQEAVAHRHVETERAGVDEPCAGCFCRCEQCIEMRYVIGNARQHRRDDQPRIHTGVDEFPQRAQPRGRNGRAHLQRAGEPRIRGDQRDVYLQLVPFLQLD